MKRNMVWTVFCVATLLMSMAAVASAKDNRTCSATGTAGEWAFTWSGTIIIGTTPVPAAAVGKSISDVEGNISGTLTSSIGGVVSQDEMAGTVTINPDCTGTLTVNIGGAVPRTATWTMVFDDNENESRAIMTSLAMPGYPPVSPIVTMISKKVFRVPGLGQ